MSKLDDLRQFDEICNQFSRFKEDPHASLVELLNDLPIITRKAIVVELRTELLMRIGDKLAAERKALVDEVTAEARETLRELSAG